MKTKAQILSRDLLQLLESKHREGNCNLKPLPLIHHLYPELTHNFIPKQLVALDWVKYVLQWFPAEFDSELVRLMPTLLQVLITASEINAVQVIEADLLILAGIASDEARIRDLLRSLTEIFRLGDKGKRLRERSGGVIIPRLCVALTPERVYNEMAGEERKKERKHACLLLLLLLLHCV